MTAVRPVDDGSETIRRGVIGLAALGVVGTTIELVFLRHWQGATQLLVWPAMVGLGAALLVVVRDPSARAIRAVRAVTAIVAAVAVIGVAIHVNANLNAGPLDRHFATTWDSMSPLAQWWEAVTGGVGPAPVLAPGALAEVSLALFVATVRHPGLRR